LWLAYQAYPVSLVTFAALLGAAMRERCDFIRPLLVNSLESASRRPILAVDVVPPFCLLSEPKVWGRLLEGKQDRHAPLNDWICDVLWQQLNESFASRADFEFKFDWVEVILAMANHKLCPPVVAPEFHPPGSFGYRRKNCDKVVQQVLQSLDANGDASPYVTSQLIGPTAAECRQSVDSFVAWAEKLASRWW
jgi:hypothetical protein